MTDRHNMRIDRAIIYRSELDFISRCILARISRKLGVLKRGHLAVHS